MRSVRPSRYRLARGFRRESGSFPETSSFSNAERCARGNAVKGTKALNACVIPHGDVTEGLAFAHRVPPGLPELRQKSEARPRKHEGVGPERIRTEIDYAVRVERLAVVPHFEMQMSSR